MKRGFKIAAIGLALGILLVAQCAAQDVAADLYKRGVDEQANDNLSSRLVIDLVLKS